ncbi:tyrosine-type recombinase/integrase [Frankia sp. Cr1]|uniref:tyrosine-type recombinase/integrase n=1 Tax=Frankia sp. Cr1 TaxID=3073931 RepID=UPI002AD46220|nr:tyrosine-type recombinase/integrase [Frankia sp. Cr1]
MGDLREGIDPLWDLLLVGWDRTLEAMGRSVRTRTIYHDAGMAMVTWLTGLDDPPGEPCEITKAQVETFLIWFGSTPTPRCPDGRGDAYTNQTFRALQQWFAWLLDEGEIEHSPMERMKPPQVAGKLVPLVAVDQVKALLAVCTGKGLIDRRDAAIIRVLADTGGRRGEVAKLTVEDVDLGRKLIYVTGKGGRPRQVAIGTNTTLAISRYLRVRAKEKQAGRPELWLAEKGRGALGADGLRQMLDRRAARAGIGKIHPHMFRHTLADAWLDAGGDEQGLADHMGWSTTQMVARYGAIGRARRAQNTHGRLGLGDRF